MSLGLAVTAKLDRQKATGIGIHGCLPKLGRVHLAQTLEARNRPTAFTHPIFAQLVFNMLQFTFVEAVKLAQRSLARRRHIDAKQRRPGHEQMVALDQTRKMAQKQGQQQHLDVRTIDVGIRQNADLAVTQTGQIGLVIGAMRIDTNGHRDVVNLVVGKQAVTIRFPAVEHLAAQRQDGLEGFVPAHLGRTAGRIPFNQKQFGTAQVGRFTIGQLARQRHAAALAFFNFLRGPAARLGLANHDFSQAFGMVDVLVQPKLELGAAEATDQPHRIARIEPLLDLPLKLRVEHLGRQHEAGPCEGVFGQQTHALGQQVVHLDEALDRIENTVAKPRLVGTAGGGRNQVHIRFTNQRPLFGPVHRPLRALAIGKGLMAMPGVLLAFEHRNHRIGGTGLIQRSRQIAFQPVRVLPGLDATGFFLAQGDFQPRQQYGLGTQQHRQLRAGNILRIEILWVGPATHPGAMFGVAARRFGRRQWLNDVTTGKGNPAHLGVAPDRNLQPAAQRIGD